jgi:hypothetical protein
VKVAVLGCGPAGLVAAHAAKISGAEVTIYSNPRKSLLFGAQYLHAPIPEIECGEPVKVDYMIQGSMDGYREKVYGTEYTGSVSPEDYEGKHYAWDIRRAYDELWELYGGDIFGVEIINPSWVVGSLDTQNDLVLSSIPLPALCMKGHSFNGQDVWALGDAPELGQSVDIELADNTVVCNGDAEPSWYRVSNIFGYKTMEWRERPFNQPRNLRAQKVRKPIDNDCDCWPNMIRIGRFGTWTKGQLVHHAFDAAMARV